MKNTYKWILKSMLVALCFTIFIGKTDAAISGTFTELQNLINQNTGEKLILEKDYQNSGAESQITISKNITIDLNGHVINANYKSRVFYVNSGYTLTIDDSNSNALHKFSFDESTFLATLNEDGGNITITGGCITGGYTENPHYSYSYGYYNNFGGGIYVDGGNVVLNSGNIIGNESLWCGAGAGIFATNSSHITINGGSISYNNADFLHEGRGGGIYINGTLTINGGEISYNKATYGGGIYHASGEFALNDALITNNFAIHIGGGIGLSNVTATIKGGIISNNEADSVSDKTWIGSGGGISTENNTVLTILDGTITKNKARVGGGIGSYYGGNVKIYGGIIEQNSATISGGGINFSEYNKSKCTSIYEVGGDVVISGNINTVNNKEENLYFSTGQTIKIADGDNVPKKGMNVGITMQTPGVFTTNGSSSDVKYFSADNIDYYAKFVTDRLKIVLDDANPTGTITIKEDKFSLFLNTITFGLFYKDKLNVTIEASDDNGIKSIEYILSSEKKTLTELQGITTWTEYETFNIESNNQYIIYAKITDKAGKVTYISSNGFIVDTTPSIILGILNNKVYYTTQKFLITEDYLDSVKLNDVEIEDYILEGNLEKKYIIKATDKAGNVTEYTIVMKKIESLLEPIINITSDNVKSRDKGSIETILDTIENIDLTNATTKEKEELEQVKNRCHELLNIIENISLKLKITEDAVEKYSNKKLNEEDKNNIKNEIAKAEEINKDNLTNIEKDTHNMNIIKLKDLLLGKNPKTGDLLDVYIGIDLICMCGLLLFVILKKRNVR